jgi:small neutral amino acid transporter SnatA (MarC family)
MIAALIGLLAAMNPAAAAASLAADRRTNRPVPVAIGGALAFVVLVVLAVAAESIMSTLDINLGTFDLGAGVVIAVSGLRSVIAGPPSVAEEPESDRGLAGFVAFPALITPAVAALAVSVGAREGSSTAAVGLALATIVAAGALYRRRDVSRPVTIALVRLFGAVGVIIGVTIALHGIRTL